jgi:hypothetical protein
MMMETGILEREPMRMLLQGRQEAGTVIEMEGGGTLMVEEDRPEGASEASEEGGVEAEGVIEVEVEEGMVVEEVEEVVEEEVEEEEVEEVEVEGEGEDKDFFVMPAFRVHLWSHRLCKFLILLRRVAFAMA